MIKEIDFMSKLEMQQEIDKLRKEKKVESELHDKYREIVKKYEDTFDFIKEHTEQIIDFVDMKVRFTKTKKDLVKNECNIISLKIKNINKGE